MVLTSTANYIYVSDQLKSTLNYLICFVGKPILGRKITVNDSGNMDLHVCGRITYIRSGLLR